MTISKSYLPQIYSATIATLGAMAMGTIIGWSSSAVGMLESGNFPSPFPVDKEDTKTYGSVFGIGAAIGALPAGSVASVLGRCLSMVVFEIFIFIGWLCLIIPKAVWMLNTGRVLQGIGVGALCALIPAYVGEISEPAIRGSLCSIFQVLVVIGILYAYIFGAIVSYVSFGILCGIWSLIHLIGVLLIPESPYYYLSKNLEEKARKSLKNLRGASVDIEHELEIIKKEIEEQNAQKYTFSQVMSNSVNRKSLYIGIGCMFFQQTSGINVVIFYMNDIFKSTGGDINSSMASIVIGIVQLFMTLVMMSLIDKAGRKILLIISAALMAVSYLALAIYYIIHNNDPVFAKSITWLPLASIAIYISAFSLGFGAIPWVVMGEIFSTEVKPYGTSLATASNWILVFVVTYVSKDLPDWIGNHGTFFTFSAFCVLAAFFAWLFVPETKNRSLSEIQTQLAGKKATNNSKQTNFMMFVKIKNKRRQIIYAISASLGAFITGTILGWSSPSLQMLLDGVAEHFKVASTEVVTANSLFGIGIAISAIPSGAVSSVFGHRVSLIMSEIFVFFGWLIIAFPMTKHSLYIGRILQGVGSGAMCAIIPAYVGEIAEADIRGFLGGLYQLFVVIGILYSYVLGEIFSYLQLNIACSLWVCVHIISVYFMPESPYYLIRSNKLSEANQEIARLRHSRHDCTTELKDIQLFIENELKISYTARELIEKDVNRKALIIGMGCMFFQQMSGINVLIFYMKDMLKSSSDHISPEKSVIFVGVIQVVMVFISTLITDKYGRKTLMIFSFTSMGISLLGLSYYYFLKNNKYEIAQSLGYSPLVAIIIYIAMYSVGCGPTPYVVIGEIFSSELKALGMGVATATNGILLWLVTCSAAPLDELFGPSGTFYIYSGFCFLGMLFVVHKVPETKNQSLAEIQSNLENS
ncbi:facilitated trehalose transporter Tret1-like [Daktulosphaira vitifoliae]|uniref:facilitated trehalose transporter Tret1-like n=1 Tax=Daktulosphaira vitifoliae TaxID=58002 RepID=UPI0021A98B87|nr:facilitated trehalose transporter Tret1-like [Daktulosphaira vitifoliae]